MKPIIGLTAIALAVAAIPQQPPIRTLVGDLEIGGPDEGRADYTFSAISGLAFAPDGRMLVTDLTDNLVRVYDQTGKYQYKFGGEGAGPGEFRAAISGVFSADRLFWVRDEGNKRINAFELGPTRATFRTSVLVDGRSYRRYDALGIDPAGRLLTSTSMRSERGVEVPLRVGTDRSGTVFRTDTIPAPPDDSIGDRLIVKKTKSPQGDVTSMIWYYQPYGSTFALALAPNGEYARAVTGRYDIEWRDASGRLLRHIRRDVASPELSAKERRSSQKAIDDFLSQFKLSPREIPSGVPARKMAIPTIAFDQLNRLWVWRSMKEGAPDEADLYDAKGKWIAIVRWKDPQLDLFRAATIAARGDQVLAYRRDSLGVGWVARLTVK